MTVLNMTYTELRCFHGTFTTGVAWQQALTHPDTWSRPMWDLHLFYLLRPILFMGLSLFFRTMLFKRPFILFPAQRVAEGYYTVVDWV